MEKQVTNITQNVIVCEKVRMAINPWVRFWGLMGQSGMPAAYDGLWLEPCMDIHSFFMRFEFDAVFMDKNGKVLHLIERMKPWRICKPVWGARVVLELDGGKIVEKAIALGDQLVVASSDPDVIR